MSDILSRLKALGVTKGFPKNPAPKPLQKHDQLEALKKTFPNGIITENDHGICFINKLVQPLSEPHGRVDMRARLEESELFESILQTRIPHKEDTLSFDTETSGLSNGSGSFIFMLGLGYFERENYVVDQLILPDLGDETAFLRQTELIFSRFPYLISYNGKGFDIPMLQSRLRFHMFPDFTNQIHHIDLLNITRRYWKTSLGSVRLANIEHYILRLQRGDEEVPGYLAPELYRDFLRDGDASHIAGVAYHNRIDVVSLSAFLLYLNELAVRGKQDISIWTDESVSESALLRYNLSFFPGEAFARSDRFSDREKKSLANGLLKNNEIEKACMILEELAGKGDTDSAMKLLRIYQKTGNREKFEECRSLAIRLIAADQTLGKWSREEKIRRIESMKVK